MNPEVEQHVSAAFATGDEATVQACLKSHGLPLLAEDHQTGRYGFYGELLSTKKNVLIDVNVKLNGTPATRPSWAELDHRTPWSDRDSFLRVLERGMDKSQIERAVLDLWNAEQRCIEAHRPHQTTEEHWTWLAEHWVFFSSGDFAGPVILDVAPHHTTPFEHYKKELAMSDSKEDSTIWAPFYRLPWARPSPADAPPADVLAMVVGKCAYYLEREDFEELKEAAHEAYGVPECPRIECAAKPRRRPRRKTAKYITKKYNLRSRRI